MLGSDMSRGLSSTERRVCRIVFASLGAMFFAFLLLNVIESSSTPAPANKVQPGTANTSSHPKQAIQSSRVPQSSLSATEPVPAQSAPDNPAPAPAPVNTARSQSPAKPVLETAIRF